MLGLDALRTLARAERGERLLDRSPVRQREGRVELRQRREDEAPVGDLGMRDDDRLVGDRDVVDQEQIDVDRPRTVPDPAAWAAEPPFDLLTGGQQDVGFEIRLDLHDGVVEIGLSGAFADQLGFVNGRATDDGDAVGLAEQLDRRLDVRSPVACIRAEPQEGGAQRETSTETSSTATGSGGSGFVARTTTPLAPNRSIRTSAMRVQSRSSVR